MDLPRFSNDLKFLWDHDMTQCIRDLLDKLRSILGTHIVEGKNQLPLIVF